MTNVGMLLPSCCNNLLQHGLPKVINILRIAVNTLVNAPHAYAANLAAQ